MGTHRRLGDYRLLNEIGRGGTAVVHLALDPAGREVAVKELRAEFAPEPEARRRLAREMAAQRRVDSPYVAPLLGGRIESDRPHLAMGYVPGTPLGDLVDAYGPLHRARVPRFARTLALALAAVHDAGVLHRDVAPGNVMVLGDRPTLIDFGIAHEPGSDHVLYTAERPQRARRMVAGTPAYLAPELIEGGNASAASDVFAWGATVAYAATGRSPFGKGSLHAVCFRILRGMADLDGIAGPLAGPVRGALSRDPADRPSARWLAGALAEWAGEFAVPANSAARAAVA
ncbi:serine/threonine-protein kinase [Spirillospora sp. NPDC052269]